MSNINLESPAVEEFMIDGANEAQYNLRLRHPERTEVYEEFSRRSALSRQRAGAKLDIRYGAGNKSQLDLFLPSNVSSPPPLLVFIHGGYWRALDKHNFSFLADAYLAKGIAVALPNYELVPTVTVAQIIAQVREAILWLASHGDEWGYDANRIVITGHSAGAHMAAKMSCRTDMQELEGKLLGYVGLSSLFDLEPLLSASVNKDLRLSKEDAKALSFYSGKDFFDVPILLAVGGLETVGFQNQSLDFAAILQGEGHDVKGLVVPDRTHFDVLVDFAPDDEAGSELFTHVLNLFHIN